MTPSFVLDYQAYIRVFDPKGFSQSEASFTLGKALTNLAHLVFCELGKVIGFPCAGSIDASPLCVHIPNVVGVRSGKKMVGINTRWIVALVAYLKTVWYRAVVKFPTETMRQHILSTIEKFAVPVSLDCVRPLPTIIGAAPVNPSPKPLDINGVGSKTVAQAERLWLPFDPSLFGQILFSDTCLLSASTLTVAWFDLLRGLLREVKLELHRNLSFLCQSHGRLQRRVAISIGVLPVHYSTSERIWLTPLWTICPEKASAGVREGKAWQSMTRVTFMGTATIPITTQRHRLNGR